MQLFLKDAQYEYEAVQYFEQNEDEQTNEHENYLIQQLQKNKQQIQEQIIIYTPLQKMHNDYGSVEELMDKYQGMCWYCSLGCNDKAWPVVVPKDSEYKIKAVMCSFPCLIGYIHKIYKYNKQKRERLIGLAKQVFIMRYNAQPRCMEYSPAKHEMVQYGGTLSQKQYKDIIQNILSRILPINRS